MLAIVIPSNAMGNILSLLRTKRMLFIETGRGGMKKKTPDNAKIVTHFRGVFNVIFA